MKESQNALLGINELIPGVILIKELKDLEDIQNNEIIGALIYKIKLERMNILNLEIDFSNSKNILLNTNKNYKKIKACVMPFEAKEVAEIFLQKNFEIIPKFNFNFNILEKSIQLKYLKEYEENKIKLYEIIKNEISKYPLEYMDLEEINQILSNLNINFIDLDFLHEDKSLINGVCKNLDLNYIIHWRRPLDFIVNKNGVEDNNYEFDYNNIKIINHNGTPFINDVKQGLIPTNNLDCVLNILTEKNNLIEKLIINKDINKNGIYKIRLCIKGEWITVIIDDYFPCIPFSYPITSSTFSNDLWVLLIQKALAKYFENYFNLVDISIFQYLNILTGCPNELYNISDFINNKSDIINFFNKLYEYIKEYNYLIIAISNDNHNYLTIPKIGYNIIDIIYKNKNIFIALRVNFFDKKIEKNKEDYIKKLNKKYHMIKNEYNNTNDILILELEDFLNEFKSIIICYTQSWEDVRIRGKFVDIGNENYSLIVSKCFYTINLEKETNMIITLFQDDDEFVFDKNNKRKDRLDISLTILKQDDDRNKEINLIKTLDFTLSSSIQAKIKLKPGNFIIFPRTSGCFFGKTKLNSNYSQTILYDKNDNKLSAPFINVIKDIFKKFDILLNRYLGYKEFKGFWECIQDDKTINEKYFNNNILCRYQSYSNGITEKGFIDFFKENYLSENGKEKVYNWLNKLGYDRDLNSLKSRCFMINFHTDAPIKVSVNGTLNTYHYNKIERLILLSEGKKIKDKGDITLIQYKSLNSNIFSIGAINAGEKVYVVSIIVNKKKGFIFSDKRNRIEKLIEPGKCEFYFYFYISNLYNNKKREEINDNVINIDIDYYTV